MKLKFSWQTWTLLLILILVVLIQVNTYSQFKHLPSPIFGGDFYRDRGFVQNVVTGYSPLSSLFYLDELQYYGYLWPTILGLIVLLTGWSVNAVYLFSVPFFTFAAGIVFYLFGREIFDDDNWALLYASIIIAGYNLFPEPKSTSVAMLVTIPLFLLFWLKYEKHFKLKHQIMAGFFLGLTVLIQGGKFVAGLGIFGIGILLLWIHHIHRDSKEGLFKSFLKNTKYFIKKYIIFAIIVLVIAMIFFGPILLRYGMDRPNPVTEYGDTKIDLLGPGWLFTGVKNTLFMGFNSLGGYIFGLAGLVGILFCILKWKRTATGFVLLWFIANLITVEHHLITKPLFNMSFLPEKLPLFVIFTGIFIVYGFRYIYLHFKKSLNIKVYLGIILIVLLLPTAYASYKSYNNDRWVQYGRQWDPTTQEMYNIRDYLLQNLDQNDVILANDESGFALAVLSARKQMLTRRTHASYFVDISERIADAAVIMYGNDIEKSKELMKKYQVTYFYMDQHLMTAPMKTRLEFKDYLEQYEVSYQIVHAPWDPAIPAERGNTYDLIIILPQEIKQEFNDLLVSERKFTINNQLFSELSRVELY